ncbi:imidazole glycerol phosphate synthase subunit hisH [Sporobacter termitidis DSM 10068]|uniref:Imidazole glycerol phosphate synthase subunit HisH n=1 Tax=Sporobacter termitidis DSM 10068 TaxID=1123282 RepID=A0A1M5VR10_9FIRM|nr:imidazole glycerol phosphate synthase subunit HisH [Sporobacter termitidis]SHH77608.1 imidazole glycerol phosphate synthase subunit hisH [Sporobacter termitidis DSM 10068]
MIAIVDYGVGNLFSLRSSLKYIGQDAEITGDAEKIGSSDRIILPGVGAFGDAAEKLRQSGLDTVVCDEAKRGKPLLGICLGMQLLFDASDEYGEHAGLGLIKGKVVSMEPVVPKGYKVPHIGWNGLAFPKDKPVSPLFKYVREGDHVYFVHSYYASECHDAVIATAEYGAMLTAAVADKNVCGTQFHPEKSGGVGLNILRAFCEI